MVIDINGELVDASQNILHHSNRVFRYGDGIFESMAMFNSNVKLIALHSKRLAMGAEVLEFILPEQLLEKNISLEIEKFRKANNFINCRIRITLFRNSDGFYAPNSNDAGFIMEGEPIENNNYKLNPEGLRLGIYSGILKPLNILSNLKTCNALLYVKAGLYKNKNGLDECILLNESKEVCESISNNIFWIKNKKIYTPPKSSGCILGVMRTYLIQYFSENKIDHEEGEYFLEDVLEADELFLSGATRGILWVKELKTEGNTIKFSNAMTKLLFNKVF